VASLTPEARRKQIELTLAYASGDPEAIYREFMNICKPSEDADFEGFGAGSPRWREPGTRNRRSGAMCASG